MTTDPIARAVAVANRLRDAGLPATRYNIESAFRALGYDDACARPDAYVRGLEALRAAASTPESTFEDAFKKSRLHALQSTRAALDDTPQPEVSAEQLSPYAPPDVYGPGLRALQQEKKKR